MWPRTALTERLALTVPIIQAPMAGSSFAELVAAVSGGGGLGSLGSAIMTPDQLREQVGEIRARSDRAFALNFFVHRPPQLDTAQLARVRARLAPYRAELGVADDPLPSQPPPFDDVMLEQVLKLAPAAVSFHFGLPSAAALAALKRAGVFVLATATTVDEALQLEAAGVDAVVAQGIEAGGHRGTFDGAKPRGDGLGLFALIPQVVDAVRIPVIAAGGIGDGRGIAAALLLGAAGVQLGTAFLATPEAKLDPLYRRVLLEPRAADTRLTRVFTGRAARGIVTQFMDEMASEEQTTLEFPLQRGLIAPLGQAGAKLQNPEFLYMWAGQAARLARAMPAAELLETLQRETEQVLQR